jgi:hypothetical protein
LVCYIVRSVRPTLTTLAFDDQTSTFIIPSGAGFEVVFCPGARSSNILDTSLEKMQQLSQKGRADKQAALISRKSRREMFERSDAASITQSSRSVLMMASVVGVFLLLTCDWIV